MALKEKIMKTDDNEKFFNESLIPEKAKLTPKIIIHRNKLSLDDLASIKEEGKFGYSQKKNPIIELEIDGEVFANGKIIKSRGEYFFKIINFIGGNK
jgi:hypothetical protein